MKFFSKITGRKILPVFMSIFMLVNSAFAAALTDRSTLAVRSFFSNFDDEPFIKAAIASELFRDSYPKFPLMTRYGGREISFFHKRVSREAGGFLVNCDVDGRKYLVHVAREPIFDGDVDTGKHTFDIHVYTEDEMNLYLHHKNSHDLFISSIDDRDKIRMAPDHGELVPVYAFFEGIDDCRSFGKGPMSRERGLLDQVCGLVREGGVYVVKGYDAMPEERTDHVSSRKIYVKYRKDDAEIGLALVMQYLEKFGVPDRILYNKEFRDLVRAEYMACRDSGQSFNPQKIVNAVYTMSFGVIDITCARFVDMDIMRGRHFGAREGESTSEEGVRVVADIEDRIGELMASLIKSGRFDEQDIYRLWDKLSSLVESFNYHQLGNVLSSIANLAIPGSTDSAGREEERIFASFDWMTPARLRQVLGLEFHNMTLVSAHFSATELCNFACPHCMFGEPKRRLLEDLRAHRISMDSVYATKEVVKRMVDIFKENGVDEIIFTGGGEPLGNADVVIWGMQYAKAEGLDVVLYTNGENLDEDMIDTILDVEPKFVRISLNAVSSNIYGLFHGLAKGARKKITARAKKNVEYLCISKQRRRQGWKDGLGASTEVSVGFVISPLNYKDLAEGAAFLRGLAERGHAPDRVVYRPVNNAATAGRHKLPVTWEGVQWVEENTPWGDVYKKFMQAGSDVQFPEEFWHEVLSVIENDVVGTLEGSGISVSFTKGRFISAGKPLALDRCRADFIAASVNELADMGICVEKSNVKAVNLQDESDLEKVFTSPERRKQRKELVDSNGKLVCTQTCMVYEFNVVFEGLAKFAEGYPDIWDKVKRLVELITSQRDLLLSAQGDTGVDRFVGQASRINHLDLDNAADLGQEKVLVHVISDAIFSGNQNISRDIVTELEIDTRKDKQYREKIAGMNYADGSDPVEKAKEVMAYWTEYYAQQGYDPANIQFDFACSNAFIAERIRGLEANGNPVKALAFRADNGNIAQVEGIILILRAMRRFYEGGINVNEFKSICRTISKMEFTPLQEETENMEELLTNLLIILPTSKLLVNDAVEMKDIIKRSILSSL